MSMPVPENTPEVDRAERTNQRLLWGIVGGIILLVLGGLFSLYITGKQASKQSTTQHAVNLVLLANERADCRTQYNSDRQAVLEHAQVVERENVADFGSYLLSLGVTSSQLAANRAALVAANDAVDKLPTLNEMVDKGYSLNGVKHPPCPMVK